MKMVKDKSNAYLYKRNKADQLRSFIATVECESTAKAAEKLFTSVSTISKQISSLEEDLGLTLFDRPKGILALNDNGKIYYEKAKVLIADFESFFGVKAENRKKTKKDKMVEAKSTIKTKLAAFRARSRFKLNTCFIKITWKRFLILLFLIFTSIYYYLYQTNYWFDRTLYNKASPLLKDVMKIRNYKIDRGIICPIEVAQIHPEIGDLMINLIKEYDDINITYISLYNLPDTIMRMTGDEKVDNVFHNKELIPCDTEKRFNMKKRESSNMRTLFKHNAKHYVMYRNMNCPNADIFTQNLEKYSNTLFAIKITDPVILQNGSYWIIKHRSYYYLFLETNGKQIGHNLEHQEERRLIFKKFTLDELRNYEHGSYWKLIKEHDIKI